VVGKYPSEQIISVVAQACEVHEAGGKTRCAGFVVEGEVEP
jgi:hypothetical protein